MNLKEYFRPFLQELSFLIELQGKLDFFLNFHFYIKRNKFVSLTVLLLAL